MEEISDGVVRLWASFSKPGFSGFEKDLLGDYVFDIGDENKLARFYLDIEEEQLLAYSKDVMMPYSKVRMVISGSLENLRQHGENYGALFIRMMPNLENQASSFMMELLLMDKGKGFIDEKGEVVRIEDAVNGYAGNKSRGRNREALGDCIRYADRSSVITFTKGKGQFFHTLKYLNRESGEYHKEGIIGTLQKYSFFLSEYAGEGVLKPRGSI